MERAEAEPGYYGGRRARVSGYTGCIVTGQYFVFQCMEKVLGGGKLARADFLALTGEETDLYDVMYAANRIRQKYFGRDVSFCSIVNAKSGNCPEDCAFCAQSSRHETGIDPYGLLNKDQMARAAREAAGHGASCFGLVIAKRGPSDKDVEELCGVLQETKDKTAIRRGGSLGFVTPEQAQKLARAGMEVFHHNLETSRRHFGKICTTHTYDQRLETVRNLKKAGLKVCCGGIFGMGETWEDRIDLLEELIGLNVDSVPLNFLYPVKGTPLEHAKPMAPMEILRVISIYRLGLPSKEIRVCGGREANLRDLQSWMFYAGANGAMLGNYLTTCGRPAQEDLRMVEDLGMGVQTHPPS